MSADPQALGNQEWFGGLVTLIMGGIVFLGVLFVAAMRRRLSSSRDARRALAKREYADRRGLEWAPLEPQQVDLPKKLMLFDLAEPKHRKVLSHMRTERSGAKISVFDFRYKDRDDVSSVHTQTVVRFSSSAVRFPVFSLEPERILDRAGALLGDMDIDFEDSPAFSKKYALRGLSAEDIRSFFSPKVREYFERLAGEYPGCSVDGSGQDLIVYKADKVLDGERLDDLVARAEDIYGFLQRTAKST